MERRKPPLHVFTSFRFFAALAVVGHHLGILEQHPRLSEFYRHWLFEGYAGVAFFFLLSGFILTYSYRDEFAVSCRDKLRNFYVSRLARTYPVHVLTFFAFFLVVPATIAGIRLHAGETIANLLLLQSFIPDKTYYFSQNPVSWSLSVELFFYALMPFILWGSARLPLASRQRALGVGIGIWLTALAINLILRNHPESHWLVYINPVFRLNEFLLGVALALATVCRTTERTSGQSRLRATAFEIVSLASLAAAVYCARFVPFPVRYGTYYTPFMAVIIFVFSAQRGYVSRLLASAILRFLGEISFSIYMFHIVIYHLLTVNKEAWGIAHFGTAKFVTIYLASILGVSAACYCSFEMPMRIGLRSLLMRKESAKEPTAPKLSDVYSRAA